ncbi:MAG: AraC family transcriptional regulator [Frankiaceae bacterium]|nr:AraC family transcriptional regulator [Frankiaceae bacterium]
MEEWRDGAFRRTLRLPGGPGILALRPPGVGADDRAARSDDAVEAALWLTDDADADAAVACGRRLLDLDADGPRIDADLSRDPALAPLVAAAPGRRVPGAVDAHEMAVRAVLGQQVSTAAARTHTARLVAAHGARVVDPAGGLTRVFPTAAALRELDPAALALPATRRRTLVGLVAALADGALDLGTPVTTRAALLALPGIGPWTADTVVMRALGDRDAFLPGDLGVRVAAERLGLPSDARSLERHSRRWSPWRAYAVQHLWATGDHAVNRLPGGGGDAPDSNFRGVSSELPAWDTAG